jgi:hypothetical protein
MKKSLNLLLIICVICAKAQNWSDMMQDPNGNFYQIQNAFYEYWKDKDITEKGKGYKAFKRWENFVERRVYPSCHLSLLNLTAKNFNEWLENNPEHIHYSNTGAKSNSSSSIMASTTWTAIGPMGAISGTGNGQFLKSGRLNFITISPTNTNVIWVGAPAGGLWKSTNGGATWTTNTDNLSVNGCSDLAIDPTNPNIMYLATGDGNAGDTRSIGVLKSIDGGLSWNTTGLTNPVTTNFLIRRLVIHPTNPLILLAATNTGIRRTTDGGVTWTTPNTSNAYDIEFQPGNPNIVYCGGTALRRSTDGGATWTTISSGIATTGVNRMAVAVTPANPNAVYVLASSSSNSGFFAFYRSTDAGLNFTAMATSTPNLLGWATAGNDSGGQGWYDLCVAASPTSSNEVVVGGVNVWRTTNGGSNWTIYGHWTGSGAPFTHADHHDLEYEPNGTLFNCNDGTVYRRAPGATSWTEISGTMNISQIYKVGTSALTANLWITGHQDNGTSTWNGTTYQARLGGDGMDCFIDRTNNNNMFGEYYNGSFQRTTNGGASWSSITTTLGGSAPWVTAWKQDPQNATTIYAGKQNMIVSTNLGTTWTALTAFPVSGSVVEFAIAPSNNQIIYVVKSGAVLKTTNAGASWTNITGSLSTGLSFANVCVSPTDPNKVWVISGNYTAGSKIFYSSNGGTTWSNMTSNLPNLPANCLVYEPGSNDRIYIGMDVGVYYRDASQTTWTLYNVGLPNTPLSDMEISPAMPGKIVAATYGRGVWMVDVVPTALPPTSSFSLSGAICQGTPKLFNNTSINSPSSYTWSVLPSVGVSISSSSAASPSITFANTGSYVVSMTTSNSVGAGNTFTQAVTVNPSVNITLSSTSPVVCSGQTVSLNASGATSYTWNPGNLSGASVVVSPLANTSYTAIGSNGSCSNTKTISVSVDVTPTLTAFSSQDTICVGASVTLNVNGASTYSWDNGSTGNSIVVSPSITTTYFITGQTGICSSSIAITQFVDLCTSLQAGNLNNGALLVMPNPFTNEIKLISQELTKLSIFNSVGQIILTDEISGEQTINTSNLPEGIYILNLTSKEGNKSIKMVKLRE